MKRRARLLLCLFASLLAFPSISRGEAGPMPDDLVARRLVSLPDGREMNMVCLGSGAPTVVFEQGLGAHILSWEKVAPAVSRLTRTCVYDRAGQGFSDPSGQPMTASNITSDLHALLRADDIKGPVILVGHSLGGLYATLYADRYLPELAGLVLVDPSFADQDTAPVSAASRRKWEAEFADGNRHEETCAAIARSGALAENNPACPYQFAPNRTPVEKVYLGYAFSHPFKYESDESQVQSFHSPVPGRSVDSVEEIEARRSFGALPVIVLTAGAERPLAPGEIASERDAQDALWKRGHDELAARSAKGQSRLVPDAGHFIQLDKPEVVIEAISNILEQARAQSSH